MGEQSYATTRRQGMGKRAVQSIPERAGSSEQYPTQAAGRAGSVNIDSFVRGSWSVSIALEVRRLHATNSFGVFLVDRLDRLRGRASVNHALVLSQSKRPRKSDRNGRRALQYERLSSTPDEQMGSSTVNCECLLDPVFRDRDIGPDWLRVFNVQPLPPDVTPDRKRGDGSPIDKPIPTPSPPSIPVPAQKPKTPPKQNALQYSISGNREIAP